VVEEDGLRERISRLACLEPGGDAVNDLRSGVNNVRSNLPISRTILAQSTNLPTVGAAFDSFFQIADNTPQPAAIMLTRLSGEFTVAPI